jgi:hypothetical protein
VNFDMLFCPQAWYEGVTWWVMGGKMLHASTGAVSHVKGDQAATTTIDV